MEDQLAIPRAHSSERSTRSSSLKSQLELGSPLSSLAADADAGGSTMAGSKDGAPAGGMHGLLAERLAEGGGALCNDHNGRCLGSRGNIDARRSGIYTSISKLAGLLDGAADGAGGDRREAPLVTIQTEKAALLVKEYGGRTVVFRVPAEQAENSETAGDAEQLGNDDVAKES